MSSSAMLERAALVVAFALLAPFVAGSARAQAKANDPRDLFFASTKIPRLVVTIAPEDVERLRADPRHFVPCTLKENDTTVFSGLEVKLKGAAGSFRDFDDKPALTLKVAKTKAPEEGGAGERTESAAAPAATPFHGLKKFHLNNSVQDDTYLNELIGAEIFRAAGIAAPRFTHARVWINERDLGFYVVKEGFDKQLVKRFFDHADGNLYDGGFCQDIDVDLERDGGKGPDDHADLKALREACALPDSKRRWARVAELVDVPEFLTFMALELMVGHWDGYCMNRNNYRLYFEPETGKAHFLPHGMDQIFGDPNASILDMPAALVAATVMKNPEWRAAYRKRIGELLPLFNAGKLQKRVEEVSHRIEASLATIDPDRARDHQNAARAFMQRLEEREKNLRKQKAEPDPKPLVFTPNVPVRLDAWRPMSECEDATCETQKVNGERMLVIACGKSGRCIASFRRNVLLAPGKYRLHAALWTKDVAPLAEEEPPGIGAGLRLGGDRRDGGLTGSSTWKAVQLDFEITEDARDVELVVELRASKGRLQIRPDSLKLTRLGM